MPATRQPPRLGLGEAPSGPFAAQRSIGRARVSSLRDAPPLAKSALVRASSSARSRPLPTLPTSHPLLRLCHSPSAPPSPPMRQSELQRAMLILRLRPLAPPRFPNSPSSAGRVPHLASRKSPGPQGRPLAHRPAREATPAKAIGTPCPASALPSPGPATLTRSSRAATTMSSPTKGPRGTPRQSVCGGIQKPATPSTATRKRRAA